jgi:hypothetical protein
VLGTQHLLLLGLLYVGAAANIMDGLGVTRKKVRTLPPRSRSQSGFAAVGGVQRGERAPNQESS